MHVSSCTLLLTYISTSQYYCNITCTYFPLLCHIIMVPTNSHSPHSIWCVGNKPAVVTTTKVITLRSNHKTHSKNVSSFPAVTRSTLHTIQHKSMHSLHQVART